ncbi:MAG: hypothetical protein DBX55_06305 [Verrucomicrobia bacterium]|nr:MAG: hypothetical protein DBX55_06305 [Verrucomicrobiota bacterium]
MRAPLLLSPAFSVSFWARLFYLAAAGGAGKGRVLGGGKIFFTFCFLYCWRPPDLSIVGFF